MSYDEKEVLVRIERLTTRDLRRWIRAGWVMPATGSAGPVFDDVDVARLRLLCDLCKDMSLSPDAVPVVLTLIDRLHAARRQLRALGAAVDRQPEDLRSAVLAAYRSLHEAETG